MFEDGPETKARAREVQYIINLLQPDPELQPYFLADIATVLDFSPVDAEGTELALNSHFNCSVDIDIRLPVWRLVDSIKLQLPNWPEKVD